MLAKRCTLGVFWGWSSGRWAPDFRVPHLYPTYRSLTTSFLFLVAFLTRTLCMHRPFRPPSTNLLSVESPHVHFGRPGFQKQHQHSTRKPWAGDWEQARNFGLGPDTGPLPAGLPLRFLQDVPPTNTLSPPPLPSQNPVRHRKVIFT